MLCIWPVVLDNPNINQIVNSTFLIKAIVVSINLLASLLCIIRLFICIVDLLGAGHS